VTDCIPQLVLSFYRQQPIHADFSGGQITSDAGLLPSRAFDQRHDLTRDLAQLLSEPRQKQVKRRYRRTQLPQRGFSSFRHSARSLPRQRRICYKAEHTAVGTDLRFLITNCLGRASEVFDSYNDRGECENRIEEFKNGFRADRLICHCFLSNAFRLLPHGFAHNLVNLFRLQLPLPWRSAQIEMLRAQLFKVGARVRQTARCVRFHLASSCPSQNLFSSVAFVVNSI
jgi:hypothetical protein